MRIFYLADSIFPSERANNVHVMKMCQALSECGHEVCLFARKGKNIYSISEEFRKYNIEDGSFKLRLFSVPAIPGALYLYGCLIFLWVLIHKKPQLVLGRFLFGTYLLAILYPTIFEIHSPIWTTGKLNKWLFKRLLKMKNLRFLISITEALKQYFHRSTKSNIPVEVLPDASSLPSTGPVKKMPSGYVLHIGYVGSLYPGKGMEIISAIVADLPSFAFHVVGGIKKDIDYWKKQIICDNIFFYGHVDQSEVSNYIRGFDVCILPNLRNVKTGKNSDIGKFTSPLKMFDYMAHGKAIVASDLPVLKEVLNEEIAIFADPESSIEWVNALNKLNDNHVRAAYGNRAYERFKNSYTWLKRAKKIIEYYEYSNYHSASGK